MLSRRAANLISLIVGCGLVVALFGCNRAFTVDDLVDRNGKAMGGRAAIEAVHSIEVSLHISDPGFEADGVYYAARPGKMRIDVSVAGKHVFTEAFDGEHGWEWNGKESTTASPKATAALQHGVELPGKLFGLHELKQRGHQVDLIGRENIDGINYYALELTLKDGYRTTLYVDPKSWFITRRRDVRPLHVDIDPTPTTIEQRSSDFREIGGVQFAFAGSEIDLKTGKVLETSQIKSIKVNPAIDPSFFEKSEPDRR
jgi:outer membrane lipoprotein-sorting protein